MKKIFALLLAIVMVMGLATVASAENLDTSSWTSKELTLTAELNKVYTVSGQTSGDVVIVPDETLTFVSTADDNNPVKTDAVNLTITTLDDSAMVDAQDKLSKSGTMTITVPSYNQVGVYNYIIKETPGSAQAAIYDSNAEIGVQVLVTYDYENNCLKAEPSLTTGEKENKLDTFTNSYALGQLNVKKTVSGNLAAKDVEFEMTVSFTSEKQVMSDITIVDTSLDEDAVSQTIINKNWTKNDETGLYEAEATIYVRADETVTFHNIPQGVNYSVVESSEHTDDDDVNLADPSKGYTVTYDGETGEIGATAATANVNNEKKTDVTTGIVMDSVPFVVMAVIAVLGLAAFTAKKRVQE